ncbi:LOW QUALITY PROTEIN: hypothetical protein PHMEG_0009924 [Phytophthora megakarya]|uniref:Uncharacterized protein n=1 Tax=Phytophthora megakarya TaxID=4795 RepID=A0A225WEZ2_9STRA|nr:LOW QUALITY PROTEIN: hypothetical protein PHMEG_0009924 [Phytophthora megakarya]
MYQQSFLDEEDANYAYATCLHKGVHPRAEIVSYLTHFEPTELPEAVAMYINEQLGGVKQTSSVKPHPDEQ